jgi:hypothetical protein
MMMFSKTAMILSMDVISSGFMVVVFANACLAREYVKQFQEGNGLLTIDFVWEAVPLQQSGTGIYKENFSLI